MQRPCDDSDPARTYERAINIRSSIPICLRGGGLLVWTRSSRCESMRKSTGHGFNVTERQTIYFSNNIVMQAKSQLTKVVHVVRKKMAQIQYLCHPLSSISAFHINSERYSCHCRYCAHGMTSPTDHVTQTSTEANVYCFSCKCGKL